MNKLFAGLFVLFLCNPCFAETISSPPQKNFDIEYDSLTNNKTNTVHINGNPIGDDQLIKDTVSHIDQLSSVFGFDGLSNLDIVFIQWANEGIFQEKWTVNKQKDLWITFNTNPPAGFPAKTQIIISEDDKIPDQKTLTSYTPPPAGTKELMSIHLTVKEGADFENGLKRFNENNFKEAIRSFDKAIKNNPENPKAYFYRANSYYNLGLFEQAIPDYSELIKLDPENSDTYSNRGDALRKLNKLDEAIADFNKVVELNPENILAYGNRAVAYFYLEDYAKSWQDAEKAQSIGLQIDPNL